jgi:hypothetical protein
MTWHLESTSVLLRYSGAKNWEVKRRPNQGSWPPLQISRKATLEIPDAGHSPQPWKTHLLWSGTSPPVNFRSSSCTGKRELVKSWFCPRADQRRHIARFLRNLFLEILYQILNYFVCSFDQTELRFFQSNERKQIGCDVNHGPPNDRRSHSHGQKFSAGLKRINVCRDVNWAELRGIRLRRSLPASCRRWSRIASFEDRWNLLKWGDFSNDRTEGAPSLQRAKPLLS